MKNRSSLNSSQNSSSSGETKRKDREITWKFENTMIPKAPEKREGKVIDFLLEQRIKSHWKPENDVKKSYQSHNWNKELVGMEAKDKARFLSEQAKLIEEKAELIDEKYKHHPERAKAVEDTNEMLIDAIAAKIEILNAI